MKRLLLAFVALAVSATLLYWATDLEAIRAALEILLSADPWLLVSALAVMWAAFAVAAERFRRVCVVLALARELRFVVFFVVNLTTMFAAVVAPVGLAADVARAGLLPLVLRASPWGSALAVFHDKLLGVLGVMLAGIPLLIIQPFFQIAPVYVWIQAALFLSVGAGMCLLHLVAPRLASEHPFLRRMFWILLSFIDQLSTRRQLGVQLALAVAIVFCTGVMLWTLGLAVGIPGVSFPLMLAVAPAFYLAQSMPFTYAGWGAREAVAVLLLGTSPGIEPAQAVALSFAFGAIFTLASLPGAAGPMLLVSLTRDSDNRKCRADSSRRNDL